MSSLPLLFLLLAAAPPATADTLVVCPLAFRTALAPWTAQRISQGHRIELVSNELSALELREEIRARARRGSLAYVVLVGDATPPGEVDRATRSRTVPTWQAAAKVITRYGGEAAIATDNGYADLDDDTLPDIAVGRLTADSPAELSKMVDKILAYERNANFGAWRRQINLLAGVGDFGPLADAAIEAAARRVISAGIPPEYALRVTYGNWRSPFCPDPRRFRQTAIDSLGEGILFWVYLGHGWPGRLADLHASGAAFPSLDRSDLKEVRPAAGAPIACLLACYTGAFDDRNDCLGEVMLATPSAPVAVICASRVTMPYAMAVMGTELLTEIFEHKHDTLGHALVSAKRQMATPTTKTMTRQGLDGLAALLNPGALEDELVEHLHLFNLLGDPLLRLRLPEPITLTCDSRVRTGATLRIEGTTSVAGRAIVELVPSRDLLGFRPPQRLEFTAQPQQIAEFDETYRRRKTISAQRVERQVERGDFVLDLRIPEAARGPCHVRVFIEGPESYAAGSANIEITTPPAPSAPARAKE